MKLNPAPSLRTSEDQAAAEREAAQRERRAAEELSQKAAHDRAMAEATALAQAHMTGGAALLYGSAGF